MLAPLKKNLFFVGPGKKMKICEYPESTIYKIKKQLFFMVYQEKDESFFIRIQNTAPI